MLFIQVDSVSPDDWQEGSIAAADSSFNQVKGTHLADPTTAVRAGLTAGKQVNALPPGTSVTPVQNSQFVSSSLEPLLNFMFLDSRSGTYTHLSIVTLKSAWLALGLTYTRRLSAMLLHF